MARIVVLGGTGYAGRHIVAEAVSRGHAVIAISRSTAADPVAGAAYVQGSALDLAPLADAFVGADAVVSALSPRGDMEDRALEALSNVVDRLVGTETRLGVVGGAGGSLVAPGGPRLFDQDFPEEYKHEAQVGIDSLALLETTDAGLDWFFIHPAEVFGPWAEGERTGQYRDGGDVLVRDADGKSFISGADFAVAVVDEIEQGNHHRERFTVGY
ncbi:MULTISPECIES: NAD(P)-dependent oxidoreductase [unclassified Microbacterium]|uniref:NAD(P)-dependent oxidoreductase n=1 Tax=unclassified Microbacterium TaxID=2609290 RepID=UPI001605186B|nr:MULTISPECIES: NAD(P)H-binding protein [unclassified Microbacterium]QNA93283.1 NAD(P)H-binding protein [Microbacterium sp. Se63.02b]QYM63493.1 NAD(P)H-binding protein [Microbacterium sp. Se5.02b]